MEYQCPNCENNIELPDFYSEDMLCDYCASPIWCDSKNYRACSHCECMISSVSYSCDNCGAENPFGNSVLETRSGQAITLDYFDNPKFLYVTNETEYYEAINAINNMDVIACDTEGNGLNVFTLELFLIQLGNDEIVYVFNFDWHDRLKQEMFWQDDQKLFVLHNAKFDYKILKHHLGIEIKYFYDTMLAERLLTCGIVRENSLKAVAKKYLKIAMDKEIVLDFISMTKKDFHSRVTPELLQYSARDVTVLLFIYGLQSIDLRNSNLENIAALECDVCIPIAEIELSGIYVDRQKWEQIIIKNEQERDRIKKELYNMLTEHGISTNNKISKKDSCQDMFSNYSASTITIETQEVNFNSTHALKNIFRQFGFELADTGDQTLADLKHPFADLLREYRGYEKQLSAFGQSFLDLVRKETDRVHPSFNQIGADTGRMSCNNPNMQQIPATEEYRSCFIAPPGRKIVTCDYSQQELRLLASLSGDPKFIKMYEDGVDLHSATASLMYNIPIDEVPKDKRTAAKTINFGLAYGRGAKALASFLGISEDEGKKMIDIYFSQFSFIGDWLNKAAENAQKLGYSETLFGRKRFYKLPSKDDPEYKSQMARVGRQGKNSPIQGSGVDMVKMALIKIRAKLREEKLDAFLVNTVHDEIVIESSEHDAERAYEIIESCMVAAGRAIVSNVPILAEAAINDFWKH